MYFWKTESLVADLQNGTLSQADRFKYLLAFMIVTALFIELSLFISEAFSVTAISEATLVVIITIFGTIWCYQTNKSGDNNEFVDRYICLFLPIMIRLIVIIGIIYLLYMILGYVLFGNAFDEFNAKTNWIDVGFTIFFEIYFYWKLSRAIKSVANKSVELTA